MARGRYRGLIAGAAAAVLALVCAVPAFAVTYDEIPYELRRRLPEFVLRIASPQALAALSLADLEEYADAYEENRLHFIAEVRVEQHSGPITPELAELILQIPEGAPFVETRFTRLASRAYGNGIFSTLQWEIHKNADDSVDIRLWYSSNTSKNLVPDVGVSGIAGALIGAQLFDAYAGGENKQYYLGAQLSEKFTDEPRLYGSYADSTLNGGRNGYSVSASIGNEYRTRFTATTGGEVRARTVRADGSYSWIDNGRVSVGAGVYHQDVYVLRGDPDGGGAGPRPADDETGTAGYVSLRYGHARRDHFLTPKHGHSYSVGVEQHFGDFQFTRASADLRQYIEAPNVLGIKAEGPECIGGRGDAKLLTPPASIALQAQASVASGEVPYTEEISLGNSNIIRGYAGARFAGTKLAAVRGEYRFALTHDRQWEAFVFSDHAWIGTALSDLTELGSFGVGALGKLPVYGGVKIGGYTGWAYDGSDSSYGINLGYQF